MKKFRSILSLVLAVLMVAGCAMTGFAAEIEETEPNETPAQATVLVADAAMAGSLLNINDKDYYKITPGVSGVASVLFAHEAQSAADASVSYFKIDVYATDAEGAETVASITSAGSSASDTAEFMAIAGTAYYVCVSAGDVCDSTVDYTISYDIEEGVTAESEPNDTFGTADEFTLSLSGAAKHHYGSISSKDDKDYYNFKVTETGALNIYFYNDFTPKGNFTAAVYVYAEGALGEQVLELVTSTSITDEQATVIGPTVCVEPGDYALLITGDAGSYKTRVLFRAASNIESEPNDSALQADKIDLNKTYKATSDVADDKDYFEFTAAEGNKGFDITLGSKFEGDWIVTVYDSDNNAVGSVLEAEITADTASAKYESSPLPAGKYYLEVKVGEEHCTDIYEIKVTERAEAIGGDDDDDDESLWDRIFALNWGILFGNLEEWLEEVNIFGLIVEIASSLIYAFTFLGSFIGQ